MTKTGITPNDSSDSKKQTHMLDNQNIEKNSLLNVHEKILRRETRMTGIVFGDIQNKNDDIEKHIAYSKTMIEGLSPQNVLQTMLCSQMMKVHELLGRSALIAKISNLNESRQRFTNLTVKLANTFIQQATTLSKLQGQSQSNKKVNQLNVHAGGQAVVGDIITNKSNPNGA
jgi:paraquat-inducible protein B